MMLVRSIKQKLQSKGFDLCHPINTAWYNKMIQDEGLIDSGALKVLPEPSPSLSNENVHCDGGDDERCVQSCYNAVLIGNTKTIWPSFLDWLEVRAAKRVNPQNPFDSFCEETLSKSLQELCCENDGRGKVSSYELFWSNGKREKFSMNDEAHHDDTTNSTNTKQSYHCFENNDDSFLVSMQRIASASGEYWHDEENTKLCVHPVYGTWTAFRALVVFETEQSQMKSSSNSTTIPPPQCPCPLSQEEMKEAKRVFDYALEMNTSGQGNNAGSYGTQANKTWDELCKYLHSQVCTGSSWDAVPESMKPWIELRNVIRVGRSDWKYDEPQLLYHYTKDPEILSIELGKRGNRIHHIDA